mgnify:CR=1 FL=1
MKYGRQLLVSVGHDPRSIYFIPFSPASMYTFFFLDARICVCVCVCVLPALLKRPVQWGAPKIALTYLHILVWETKLPNKTLLGYSYEFMYLKFISNRGGNIACHLDELISYLNVFPHFSCCIKFQVVSFSFS